MAAAVELLLVPFQPRDHGHGRVLHHDRHPHRGCHHCRSHRPHLFLPLQVRRLVRHLSYHPWPHDHDLHPHHHGCFHPEGVPTGFGRSEKLLMSCASSGARETHSKDVVKLIPCSHEDILVLDDCLFQHPTLCLGALANLNHVAFRLRTRQPRQPKAIAKIIITSLRSCGLLKLFSNAIFS